MILGMSTSTFTLLHVLISLAGIGSGVTVVFGLLGGKRLDGWNAIFLLTTVLTSATGFLFPIEHLLPSHIVGTISLIVLAVAILARYAFHLAGGWARTYVVAAMMAFYLQLFCWSCAGLPESTGAACACSEWERAGVPGSATRRAGAFCAAHDSCGEKVPR